MEVIGVISVLLGLLPLAVIGFVIYLVIRKKPEGQKTGPRLAYFFLVSFITLGMMYWAIGDMVRLLTDTSTTVSYRSTSAEEQMLRGVAGRLAVIMVALPLWAFHWFKANPKKGLPTDDEAKKAYALAVVICTMLVMLVTWPLAIYYLLTWVMGVAETSWVETIPTALTYAVLGLLLWGLHFGMWRRLNKEEVKVV